MEERLTENPIVDVSCAIIEENGNVLATQRGTRMKMPLKWEFPGGKIDPGETAEACIVREIDEELGIRIQIRDTLPHSTYSYPDFCVRLHPFVCEVQQGDITLKEHRAFTWISPSRLLELEWVKADVAVVNLYLKRLEGRLGQHDG